MRPLIVVVPCVCSVMPQRICSSVDLARAVAPDDADAFALRDLKRDVAEDPMLLVEGLPAPEQRLLQLVVAVHEELERLADPLAADDGLR